MKILGAGAASGEDAGILMSSLRRLDLFAPLSDDQLRKVIYFIKSVTFEAGETVFKKDDPGDSFYVVQAGKVEARGGGFLGFEKIIRSMGPGEFFGELALILKRPRSASIVCVEDAFCYALDASDLELLMERNPDIASAIKNVAKERLENHS
jgi:voltage-gated potassium channel